jgi:hypothetical protein
VNKKKGGLALKRAVNFRAFVGCVQDGARRLEYVVQKRRSEGAAARVRKVDRHRAPGQTRASECYDMHERVMHERFIHERVMHERFTYPQATACQVFGSNPTQNSQFSLLFWDATSQGDDDRSLFLPWGKKNCDLAEFPSKNKERRAKSSEI